MIADSSEKNDTSTPSEQELPVQRTLDSVEVNTVNEATDVNDDPRKDSDDTIDVENMNVEEPDRTSDSMDFNTVDKANDANGQPSQGSDDRIDAANMNVDEPDCASDSVEVNTGEKAHDATGQPSQDSDDRIDAENMNVDEPDIIHDSSKTNDANAEQTESMVDDDVEQNDVSTNINQGLQKETVSDDVEMEKADKTTDAFGHANR